MASTIHLIEDDAALADVLSDFLQRQGFVVAHAADGPSAVQLIRSSPPDLVLLDVMLPGFDGLEVCRRIRPGFAGPVVMLTAKAEDIDEIIGLEVGADDYLRKPVNPRVLLARIRAMLRRGQPSVRGGRHVFQDVVVDAGRYEATVRGCDVGLTTAEFELLWLLVDQAGVPVSRDVLHESLRGVSFDGMDRSMDLRVSRVRRKLGEAGERIRAVRGVGYLWAVDP